MIIVNNYQKGESDTTVYAPTMQHAISTCYKEIRLFQSEDSIVQDRLALFSTRRIELSGFWEEERAV